MFPDRPWTSSDPVGPVAGVGTEDGTDEEEAPLVSGVVGRCTTSTPESLLKPRTFHGTTVNTHPCWPNPSPSADPPPPSGTSTHQVRSHHLPFSVPTGKETLPSPHSWRLSSRQPPTSGDPVPVRLPEGRWAATETDLRGLRRTRTSEGCDGDGPPRAATDTDLRGLPRTRTSEGSDPEEPIEVEVGAPWRQTSSTGTKTGGQ